MKRYGLNIMTAVLLLTACSSEQDDALRRGVDDGRVALQVSAAIPGVSIEANTRATGNAWAEGDAIGVYAFEAGTTTPLTNGTNKEYTTSQSGSTAAVFLPFAVVGDPIYLPLDGTAAEIYAYYPRQNIMADPEAVAINVAVQSNQAAIDWMTTGRTTTTTQGGSTPITRDHPDCELQFSHRLCKLQFNLKGEGITSQELEDNPPVIAAGLKTTGSINLMTGAVTATDGNATAINPLLMASPATGYDKSYEAIILPQELAAPLNVTITIGTLAQSVTYTFAMPAQSFTAGNRYIYNVTVKNKKASVDCTIDDWTNGVDIDAGTINM